MTIAALERGLIAGNNEFLNSSTAQQQVAYSSTVYSNIQTPTRINLHALLNFFFQHVLVQYEFSHLVLISALTAPPVHSYRCSLVAFKLD